MTTRTQRIINRLDQWDAVIDAKATITNSQIRALRREAGSAGDTLQIIICDIALSAGLDSVVDPGEHRADLEYLGIVPEHVDADVKARAECARVIAEAAAR